MSNDHVTALLKAIAADPGLMQRFTALPAVEDAVALAADLGYLVTAEELTAAMAGGTGELSDTELASAAGGTYYLTYSTCNGCTNETCTPPPIPVRG